MSNRKDLQNQLTISRRRLQKLQERRALQGITVDPSVLIEIEDIQAEIERLEAESAGLVDSRPAGEAPPAGQTRPSRRPGKIVAGLGVVILFAAALLGWRFLKPTSPAAEPTEALAVCQPEPGPVQISIARLSGCPATLEAELASAWKGAALPATPAPESDSRAGIVLAGICDDESTLQATFELPGNRRPAEIYEPATVSLTGDQAAITSLGLALLSYQQGDYETAASRFEAQPPAAQSPETALLRANSLLFLTRYTEAISAYREITSALAPTWAAAANNLGMARYSESIKDREGSPQAGLDSIDQAIELALAQGETDVALLAHANKALILLDGGNWQAARTSCDAAGRLNARSPLYHLCLVALDFKYSYANQEKLPINAIDANLAQVEQSDETIPPLTYYYRATWYSEKKQPAESAAAFQRYLEEMRYRACLKRDQEAVNLARYYLTGLAN